MKYPNVLGQSEEDCGPACLATISKHYGRIVTVNYLRDVIGTGREGSTLLGLKRGAEKIGFDARTVKAPLEVLDKLGEITLPAIIHWKGHHWVVLYGKQNNRYVIADPSVGIRYLLKAELAEAWANGIMLLLEMNSAHFFTRSHEEQSSRKSFFLYQALRYRNVLCLALIINLALGLLSLTLPLLIQTLTDTVLVSGNTHLLTAIIIAAIVMNLFSSGLSFIQADLVALFIQNIELEFTFKFVYQLLRLPLHYYEGRRSGEVTMRLDDIQEINYLILRLIAKLPSQFFVALVSLLFMFFYNRNLTAIAILNACLTVLTTLVLLPTLQRKIRETIALASENHGVLLENFRGALTIKTTNAIHQSWQELRNRFTRLTKLKLSSIRVSIINRTSSTFISEIGSIILLWFGSTLVISNQLTVGQLIAFNAMNLNFMSLIDSLVDFGDDFVHAKVAAQRLIEIIDATPEDQRENKKPFQTISDHANIVCNGLNFNYSSGFNVVENLSIFIPGGQVTVIVGRSGSGKSTLAKLLSGLYPLQVGSIHFGLHNLQDLSLSCLRQQVVFVSQDIHFWHKSIFENLCMNNPDITYEQVVEACRITDADDFVNKLLDKYETVLGEFGSSLSGGQRQRLAIARAIVMNPAILILDESTSALDPITETSVLDRLLAHRQQRTTILISHRPKVVERADWIAILEDGRLKLQGKPEELELQLDEYFEYLSV